MCHFFTLIDDLRQKYFILNQENYISSGDLFTTVKKNRSCILALMQFIINYLYTIHWNRTALTQAAMVTCTLLPLERDSGFLSPTTWMVLRGSGSNGKPVSSILYKRAGCSERRCLPGFVQVYQSSYLQILLLRHLP